MRDVWKKSYFVLLHVAVVALCVEVVILFHQNEILKQGYSQASIINGDRLNLAQLVHITSHESLPEANSYLLFLFGTSCRLCEENRDVWSDIAELWSDQQTWVVGVSIDSDIRALRFFGTRPPFSTYVAVHPGELIISKSPPSLPQTVFL
jgi:hypothetical protein